MLLAGDDRATALAAGTPLAARTITDVDRLEHELADARPRGVAFDREEVVPGLSCVAAPVLSPGGRVIAALSMSATRSDSARVASHLRRITHAAAQTLVAARIRRQEGARIPAFAG